MLAAGAPLLAQLPIDPQVSALCDAGNVEMVTLEEIPALLKAFTQAMPVAVNALLERSLAKNAYLSGKEEVMSDKVKIGIIICDRYRTCAGGKCLRAMRNKEGAFAQYADSEIELVGYTYL